MRLGLIALSGLRAENATLTKLGLTLPGFIERNKTIASLPSLSLLTLAGMTPKSFNISYWDLPDITVLPFDYDDFDTVLISSFSAQIKDAYKLAAAFRSHGVTVIMGGLHVSACPEEASLYADTIVIGEAEPVWQTVVKDLQYGTLKPTYNQRRTPFDLAAAPMPAFQLLNPDSYNRITIQTQRGCPLSCEFCASSIRLDPKYKTKPIEKIIAEVDFVKSLWPKPFIEFADDNTFASKAHGKKLARSLLSKDVRWFTETDISIADDPDLLSLVRDSGCAQLLIGLEDPSRMMLQGIELNADWKARRADTYLSAIHKIQSKGISVNGCFVLGLDTHDKTCFDNVFDFVRTSGLCEVQVTLQTPFPGTPLYNRLQKSGRLLDETGWEKCTLFDVNFQPEQMTVEELEQGFTSLVERLYQEEETAFRRRNWRKSQRPSRVQGA